MKKSAFFVISAIAILISGIGLYKKFSPAAVDNRKICIFTSSVPGFKEDAALISQALILQDIKKKQIVFSQKSSCEKASIKIFLEQEQFSEFVKNNNDESLKIGIHLHDPVDEEDPKIIGLFDGNNIQQLLELIENIIKGSIHCLLIYDAQDVISKYLATQYQELAKIKGADLEFLPLSEKHNVATVLKSLHSSINSVILLPSSLIFKELEIILEYFKLKKIPVFANHAGLIRAGALGGYDFDMQEVAHDIAEISSSFLSENIKTDAFEEVYPQIHLNMDTLRHLNIELSSEDLLDEAITVGGVDL